MRLLGLLVFIFSAHFLRAQCSCTDCPVLMPSNQTVTSTIDISGATNDQLGVNGQSLQAICINMVHDAIDEIEILLIAPDGSSVLLIDNTGLSSSQNIEFQICFVACSDNANPDPGFSEVFNSQEPWQSGASYDGSYYPSIGCLENLTGDVNGEWILEMTDFVGLDDGTMFDWCLQFSDDDGLGCGTTCFEPGCQADGGSIPDVSGDYCQGEAALNFDLTPVYTGSGPDPALFNYTYVQVDPATNEVLGFTVNTDFTFYFPGTYEMCGISYLASDEPLMPFPPPPGYTYDDLINDIDAGVFCADLSDNCITVNIDTIPEMPEWSGPTSVCPGENVTYEVLNYDPVEYAYLFTITQGSFSLFITNGGSIDVAWISGPGELCVSATNDCGTIDTCLVIEVGSPDTVEIVGNTEVCDADFETYTLSPPLESGQQYVVSVTNGIAFPVQGNTVQVNWDPGTSGEICVSVVGPGCLPEEGCLEVEISPFSPPTFVDNSLSLCLGQEGFASVPDDPEVINYNWFGDGFTILSGQGTNQIDIQADIAGTTETCVELETSCGLDTVCSQLIIFDIPDPMITNIQGSPECGEDFFIFLVFSPGTDLLWSVIDGPPGGLTLNGVNAAVVNVDVNLSGTYSIQIAESIGDCVGYDTITIDVVSGLGTTVSTECDLDGNFTVTLVMNGGTEPFVVNGVTIAGNEFVSDPLPSGSSYSYTIEDANGCSAQVGGTGVCPCISSAGTMDQTLVEVCGASGGEVTALVPADVELDNNDVGVFVLHEGAGSALVNILEINSTGIFGFLPGMSYGVTYYISHVVGNDLGGSVDLNDPCLSVAAGQPVVFYDLPGIQYNGPTSSCDYTFTLDVNLSSDALNTAWTVSGPGLIDVQILATESAIVTVSAPGTYNFEVITTNGPCFNSVFFDFEVFEPLSIVQAEEECDGSDLYVLTLEVSGGTQPYTADVPGAFNGAVYTSEFLSTSAATTITISDDQGCQTEYISGPIDCDCISESGFMSLDTISICEGETEAQITFLGGGEFDGDDTESFVLHSGPGTVIIDPIFVFTGNTFGIIPGLIPGRVYYISHVVGNDLGGLVDINDPCLDVSVGQPFIIYALPSFSIPASAETCPGTVGISISNAGLGGIATVLSNSAGGAINLEVIGSTISVGSAIPTVVEVEYIEAVGSCIKRDTVIVTFLDNPEIVNISETCFGTGFVVTFEINGAFGPFTVNGQQVSGTTFVSDTFNSGETADFIITDQRGCFTSYSTTVDCACDLDAGNLTGMVDALCVGDTLFFSDLTLTGSNIGVDDTLLIILYDGTAGIVDSILSVQDSGVFPYDSSYEAGVTYYIAALGTSVFNDEPDYSDPCLSLSNGIPVTWFPANTAALGDSIIACAGDSVIVTVTGGGGFPFEVYLTSDSGRQVKVTLNSGSTTFAMLIDGGVEVWTIDSIGGNCALAGTGEAVIIGELAEEPVFNPLPEVCNNPLFGSVLNLDDQLVNGVDGEWSSPDFAIINNSIDFDGVAAGTYDLVFTTFPIICAPQSYDLQVEVLDCDCPVIAFPNGINLCVTVSDYDLDDRFNIAVEGNWAVDNFNNLPQPPQVVNGLMDLVASTPGTYGLIFTVVDSIPDQCEDTFSLNLTVVAEPDPGVQSVFPVLCEGVSQDLDLNMLLEGADSGGSWSFVGNAVPNVINSGILSTGANVFIYTVENNLCGERMSQVSVELGEPPFAGIANDTIEFCENESVNIQLEDLLTGGDLAGTWRYEGEVISSTINSSLLSAGLNRFTYEVGIAPCSDTAEVFVFIRPLPSFLLAVLNVSCYGENDGYLQVEPDDDGLGPYTVRINAIVQSQILNAEPGSYLITVEDGAGCVSSELVAISEPEILELDLVAPDSVVEGETAAVTAFVNTGDIADALWTFNGSVVDSSALELVFIPAVSDSVTLELVDGNGCVISDQLFIQVVPEPDTMTDTMAVVSDVFIPNVFNPNSVNPDNRRFTVQFNDNVAEISFFRIFDRWGALVYEVLDAPGGLPLEGWDGTYNGKVVNPGVFVYSTSYETVEGEVVLRYGDVTVVR